MNTPERKGQACEVLDSQRNPKNRTLYFSEKKVEKWKSETGAKCEILAVENALCAAHLAAAKRYFRVSWVQDRVPTVKGSEGSATP